MNTHLNYKAIFKILGTILIIISISMIPALLCAFYYNEPEVAVAFAKSALITFAVGITLFVTMKFSKSVFKSREGYFVVALAWIGASLFGTLPYLLSGFTDSFVNAFFESTSGFTTTGASVLDVDTFPKALLLWKTISNWLGGMGILIFIISLFPALGINGRVMARLETPSPVLEKITIKMTNTAKILYLIYFGFTLLEFLLLSLSGKMDTFDALVNSLSSISTSGLFCHSGGLTYYNSAYVEIVISIFAILGSLNFILYSYAARGNWKTFFKDIEMKVFFKILLAAVIICFLGLWLIGGRSFGQSLRYAFGQVTSFMTTSGYTVADFNYWPSICQITLLSLLFIGTCSASTGGSIKVIRVIVFVKYIYRGMFKRLHPRSVTAIKLGKTALPPELVSGITVFVLSYFGIFFFASFVLSLQGLDLNTTISTAAGILANTGIGFGESGVTFSEFNAFAPALKLFMSILMLIGRLELFTIIVLFTKSFWKKAN